MTPAPDLAQLIATVEADAPTAEPLDRLGTASATVADLAAAGDALLGHFVEECRRAGRTWTEISGALGVTKQAAHKRFTPAAPTMERYTPRARMAVAAAVESAKALGHTFVGTEHLLLGLFEPEGSVAERLLTAAGLRRDEVEATVLERTPRGAGAPVEPPYTPRAAAALATALTEAVQLGHNYIGTEHLALGLFTDPESLAARILADAGATKDGWRATIVQLLAGYRG